MESKFSVIICYHLVIRRSGCRRSESENSRIHILPSKIIFDTTMKPGKNCTDLRYKRHNLLKKVRRHFVKCNFADTQTAILDQFLLGF